MDKVKETIHKVTAKINKDETHNGNHVLITGGTGFVATWVINQFLSNGYQVRTTVRSNQKAQDVRDTHSKYSHNLDFAIVSDITLPGAFDEAVKGIDGVIHTASPFVFPVEDNKRDLLDPAIKGTSSILESIASHASQVKRVVITSSFASIIDLSQGSRLGYTYTEKDWNPVTYAEAAKPDADGGLAYCASKVLAEKAAHDFVREKKPNFTVAAICPPMIYGPLAQKAEIGKLNTSAADIWRFLDGSLEGQKPPTTDFPAFVDVRNVAQAHLRAYELSPIPPPSDEGERYLVTGGSFTYTDVCSILRKNFSLREHKIPDPKLGEKEEYYGVDNTKASEVLHLNFTSLENCIRDTGNSLTEVEEASIKGVGRYDGQEWFTHV